eukprot:3929640-Rhodomonas_salina.1
MAWLAFWGAWRKFWGDTETFGGGQVNEANGMHDGEGKSNQTWGTQVRKRGANSEIRGENSNSEVRGENSKPESPLFDFCSLTLSPSTLSPTCSAVTFSLLSLFTIHYSLFTIHPSPFTLSGAHPQARAPRPPRTTLTS